ncbi:MAG: 2-octaprenyl-6-methoxyphenyl hydroxylase [Gammaproteobacteria bacterium]|nr:2-octaprenyl-6-methoxyphenyl hydroxylase [Gammaproteobacteria bacterium]
MRVDQQVCIVGGGLVGLAAAITLAHQGRKVTLLEASSLEAQDPQALDARSLALSYSTIQILRSLGLWNQLQSMAAPIKHIHVSSAGFFGVTRLDASDLKLEAMGYVIEYHLLLKILLRHAQQHSAIDIITMAQVDAVEAQGEQLELHYQLHEQPQTRNFNLVVVADGANSPLRQKLGISVDTLDYQQSALVANIKLAQDGNGWAYERFTDDGPLALLPLPGQRYALVWTHAAEHIDQRMALSDQALLQQLHDAFGYRLGEFIEIGTRARFDLKLTRASRLVAGRCVLIGNAANSLHPVAGQGFNLALRDIAQLYDSLLDVDLTSAAGTDQLLDYQRLRQADQQQTVGYGHGLVSLFSNDLPVLNHLRAGALAALDLLPALKREVSWQGMGYGAGCSSLMRGVD